MNYRNFIKKEYSIFSLLTLLLSAFPILPYIIRSLIIILMLISFFIYSGKQKWKNISYNKSLFFSLLPFAFLLLSLFYSEDLHKGIQRLIQMLPFFVFPIIYYSQRELITEGILAKCLMIFAFSVVLLVIYQTFYSLFFWDYVFSEPTKIELKNLNLDNFKNLNESLVNEIKLRRFRNFLSNITDTHTTYQGVWIVFTLAIISLNVFKQKSKIIKAVLVVVAIFLISWLFIISTRGPLLALIVASITSFILYKNKKIRNRIVLILIISMISIIFLGYKIFPGFKLRIDEVFITKLELPTRGLDIYSFNSTNVRYGIYYCAFDIIKENLLFGVGVGDLQKELNICYENKINAKVYLWNDYNTHNQFLFFWGSSGVFGVIFFVMSLMFFYKAALKENNLLYIFFIVSSSIVFLTENVLSRSDGVIFYSFFNSIMLFKSTLNKKNDCN